MTRIARSVFTVMVLTAGVTSAFAGGRIATRKENQQNRIAQGVKSGSLTAHETARIERRETGLNREIRRDRAANGGNLTNNQKAKIERQQDRLSKSIYRQKHDGQVQH